MNVIPLYLSFISQENELTTCRNCFCVIKITLRVILLVDIVAERGGEMTFRLESIRLSNILDTQF